MSFISDFFKKNKEKKKLLESYENNDRVSNTIENRKLSHDERELIKSLEEEKRYWVKEALKHDARKRQLEDKKKGRELMSFKPMSSEKDDLLKWGKFND